MKNELIFMVFGKRFFTAVRLDQRGISAEIEPEIRRIEQLEARYILAPFAPQNRRPRISERDGGQQMPQKLLNARSPQNPRRFRDFFRCGGKMVL